MAARRHMIRRGTIIILPIAAAAITALLVPASLDYSSYYELIKVIVGVWATLLGFIITAVSILVTFTGSRLTEEIKQTGHFKTVLFAYILTCIDLLIFLAFFLLDLIVRFYSLVMVKLLIAAIVVSVIDIFLCLAFLSFVIYTIFK